eukprot:8380459-Pyramimonas_sp.AAC.1
MRDIEKKLVRLHVRASFWSLQLGRGSSAGCLWATQGGCMRGRRVPDLHETCCRRRGAACCKAHVVHYQQCSSRPGSKPCVPWATPTRGINARWSHPEIRDILRQTEENERHGLSCKAGEVTGQPAEEEPVCIDEGRCADGSGRCELKWPREGHGTTGLAMPGEQ